MMEPTRLPLASIALTMLLASGPASAEEKSSAPPAAGLSKPSPRQGHYLALGIHLAGGLADDKARGRRGPAVGRGYTLRLGERITERFDVGIAFAIASVGGAEPWSFGRLTVHGQAYLSEKWFLSAGFGFGGAGGEDPDDPDFARGSYGDVYTIGAGRNLYLSNSHQSGGWILTPVVTLEYNRDSEFANAAAFIGVELSHWWGVPKRQLDLSVEEAY